MDNRSKVWWKDPKFIIPSILVPIIIAFVGLLPSFLPDRISDELFVTLSMGDPRRGEAGFFDMTIEKSFVLDDESESKAAKRIAHSILDHILSNQPTLRRDREKISIVIGQEADGTLFIKEPQNKLPSLHLSRFSNLQDIESLIVASRDPSRIMMQYPLVEPALPTEASEISILDRKMRAGVYRIIVTAPGYNDHSTYLQLTDVGKLFTISDSSAVVELSFPIIIKLNPKSSGTLKIAIRPCHTILPMSSKPKFTTIDAAIRSELAAAFHQQGFISIDVKEEQKVGFDLKLSKGMAATEGLVSADLLIGNCRCKWME